MAQQHHSLCFGDQSLCCNVISWGFIWIAKLYLSCYNVVRLDINGCFSNASFFIEQLYDSGPSQLATCFYWRFTYVKPHRWMFSSILHSWKRIKYFLRLNYYCCCRNEFSMQNTFYSKAINFRRSFLLKCFYCRKGSPVNGVLALVFHNYAVWTLNYEC